MPVDAKLEDEVSLNFEMTRVDDVLTALARARGVRILILDACRDNPLAQRLEQRATTRSLGGTRGFAKIERTQGTLIAFATQANDVSLDGTDRNSPFTKALLKDIETPNLEIGTLFRRVTAEVNRQTNGRQTPELSISILGEFYFKRSETDLQVWARISSGNVRADFEDFVARFPQSPFAELARGRLRSFDQVDQEPIQRPREQELQEARLRIQRELAEEQQKMLRELAERSRRAQEELAKLAGTPVTPPVVQVAPPTPPALPVSPAGPPPAPHGQPAPVQSNVAALPPQLPSPPVAPPPVAVAPDRGTLIIETKKELARLGCYTGPQDRSWPTAATNKAVADFNQHAGITTKFTAPSLDFLNALKEKTERVCPLVCGRGTELREGQCVAVAPPPPVVKPAPARPVVAPVAPKPRPVVVQPRPKPAQPRAVAKPRAPSGGGGRCFTFNGQRFCE